MVATSASSRTSIETVTSFSEISDTDLGRSGRLLAYGEQITHAKGREVFEARSLQWGDSGVVLYEGHGQTPRQPVGIVHPVQAEARIRYPLPNTASGRRVAEQVRGGELKGLSVEFRSASERRENGVRRIEKAWLTGLAVVKDPAYASASVEVRRKSRRRVWPEPVADHSGGLGKGPRPAEVFRVALR